MENFRQKFIQRDIETLKANFNTLTDWEKGFYASVKDATDLTQDQFNKLQEIARECMSEKI